MDLRVLHSKLVSLAAEDQGPVLVRGGGGLLLHSCAAICFLSPLPFTTLPWPCPALCCCLQSIDAAELTPAWVAATGLQQPTVIKGMAAYTEALSEFLKPTKSSFDLDHLPEVLERGVEPSKSSRRDDREVRHAVV